jgi:aerotaxis receptor
MESIDEAVRHVSSIIAEVANASSEQAAGISQVTQAVTRLDGATQQNAALVEWAATTRDLSYQAVLLNEAIALFSVGT